MGDWEYWDQSGLLSHLVPSDGSFSAGRSINSIAGDNETEAKFTWNDGIFVIDRAYGIDTQLVRALNPAVSAQERDADRPDALPVHGDLVFDYLAGVCQHEIVKGDLMMSGSDPTGVSLSPMAVNGDRLRRYPPIVRRFFGRTGGVAIGRC